MELGIHTFLVPNSQYVRPATANLHVSIRGVLEWRTHRIPRVPLWLSRITNTPLGPTDQRSQIRTFNIAPTWTRLLSSDTVLTFGAFVRHDQYNYYPSNNFFDDLGPLQDETVSQLRFLTNAGVHGAWSYVKGIHNIKVGATYEQTFLTESDRFGIVNPALLAGAGCPDSG